MLQEGQAADAPVGMVPAEQDEPQMQMLPQIQPMQMEQGEGPTRPQMSMQGMNQFNPALQMMMPQNMFAMEMDDYE